MEKKQVLLIMHRKMLADTLALQLQSHSILNAVVEENYASAVLTAEALLPEVAVMEIPETGVWSVAEKCLSICDVMHRQLPLCKLVVLCCDYDADVCRAVIQAYRANRIDDFLYYDTSIHYLFSKLESLTQQ